MGRENETRQNIPLRGLLVKRSKRFEGNTMAGDAVARCVAMHTCIAAHASKVSTMRNCIVVVVARI